MSGFPYNHEQAIAMLAPSLFELLIDDCKGRAPVPMAVCWPCTEVALAGAVEAAESGLILPQLVGPAAELYRIADLAGINVGKYELVDVSTEHEAAAKSTELCRAGYSKALMKGSLHTDLMMQYVVAKDSGLHTSRRISHVFIMEAPLYRRPLLITDAAINIQPRLEEKVDIVRNAIDLAHILGNPRPKVAILSAIETVNSKIPSTLDAAALCKMADRDQITGAILDGPLAFDTAVSREAAAVKLLHSPVAGEADIVVVPDLESGNMLAKQLEYLGGARLAGIVLGAKMPIVLTSRADSAETRAASCAVASVLVHNRFLEVMS
ncbi:MAG TPA: bifunctional enoyl-CoA hydratase/phosphate acetyltransferase [Acidobacteriaceae bacterium]|nr:bifunctional enoyl-CoA hydratase/phosphate acetyltransferase [Acidobacteriaceae bacterium]